MAIRFRVRSRIERPRSSATPHSVTTLSTVFFGVVTTSPAASWGTIRDIPPEWYEDDYDAVMRLLEQLYRRRTRVPELLLAAKNTTRQPFPNWR